jgi:hypothetical protein
MHHEGPQTCHRRVFFLAPAGPVSANPSPLCLSVSPSLSLSLSLCHSISLALSLSLSLSSLSLSLCLSLPRSLSLSRSQSLSLYISTLALFILPLLPRSLCLSRSCSALVLLGVNILAHPSQTIGCHGRCHTTLITHTLYHLNREINNALRSKTLPCLHRPAEIPEHVFWLGREK